jgi:pyruvate/2-oxoglutarate dehydrogenase complex dihydrolipoamide dehydrogenase (E3) component
VTPGLVKDIAPDALIVALGAKPIIPDIPGIEDKRVVSVTELHKAGQAQELGQALGQVLGQTLGHTPGQTLGQTSEHLLGQNIVIIGGGLSGCEEGINLAKYHGKDVTVIEMTDTLAAGAPYVHYLALQNEFAQLPNLRFVMGQRVSGIDAAGVRAQDGGVYPADTVVVAAGMRPLAEESEALRGIAPYTAVVGVSRGAAAQMNEAVLAGYFAGYTLQRI